MKKVLVLEDEKSIRDFVVLNLSRAGYDIVEADTGERALELFDATPDIDIAVLDVMLPGIDGFEVCKSIRASNQKVGIIMLTAKVQETDKVTGAYERRGTITLQSRFHRWSLSCALTVFTAGYR